MSENKSTGNFLEDLNYTNLILEIKTQIKSTSQKVIHVVNSELINLYYEIGKKIVQKQESSNWGDGFISQIETDLKLEFPNLRGFSRSNLF